jgi:hypothetical protein
MNGHLIVRLQVHFRYDLRRLQHPFDQNVERDFAPFAGAKTAFLRLDEKRACPGRQLRHRARANDEPFLDDDFFGLANFGSG